MAWGIRDGIHEVDGSKVYFGFNDGSIAQTRLPERITSYAREGQHFPEFTGRFAPPEGAEFVAAVCWNSRYLYMGLDYGGNDYGFHDLRHAYFVAPSPAVKWTWLLLNLDYDHDNELWQWHLVAATDREMKSSRDAGYWLLESFWYWDTARVRSHATPIAEIFAAGLLSVDQIDEMGRRIFPPPKANAG